MNFRDDLLDFLIDRFRAYPDVKRGMIFGCPSFQWSGRYFCCLYEDGALLKLSCDDYNEALKQDGWTPFAPMGERPMGTWTVISLPDTEDYLEAWEWFDRAYWYIQTDAAAPVRKSARKKNAG
ncbi:MAG: hypothetical protein FJY67_10355 [Calditrichaeota bacterium]|nr:hypothetical protein [Calditrichota bacterium]